MSAIAPSMSKTARDRRRHRLRPGRGVRAVGVDLPGDPLRAGELSAVPARRDPHGDRRRADVRGAALARCAGADAQAVAQRWRCCRSGWCVLSNGLVNLAETEVGSGLAAIAVASMPLFAGVFAMLRGRHPSRIEWIGLVIGFLGVLWLNAGSELSSSHARPGVPDHRAARLGLGLDLEPRPRPARAVHGRRRADARRQRCGCCVAAMRRAANASPRCRRSRRPRRCCTWSSPVRSSASPPTSGCCTTCARRWRPATPTSIRRSRCCSARCSAASASPRTTSARWR